MVILNTNSSGLERENIGADESANFGHEGRQSASGGPVLDLVGHVLHLLGERGQVLWSHRATQLPSKRFIFLSQVRQQIKLKLLPRSEDRRGPRTSCPVNPAASFASWASSAAGCGNYCRRSCDSTRRADRATTCTRLRPPPWTPSTTWTSCTLDCCLCTLCKFNSN